MISTLMSGIVRQELRQRGPEDRLGGVLAGRDADGAGGLLAQLAQRGELGVDLVEPRADGAEQALARLGRRDAARGAGQQPQAEPLLQPADGVAQRRLRDAELRRGPVKLRSRATARKASRSFRFCRAIHESNS